MGVYIYPTRITAVVYVFFDVTKGPPCLHLIGIDSPCLPVHEELGPSPKETGDALLGKTGFGVVLQPRLYLRDSEDLHVVLAVGVEALLYLTDYPLVLPSYLRLGSETVVVMLLFDMGDFLFFRIEDFFATGTSHLFDCAIHSVSSQNFLTIEDSVILLTVSHSASRGRASFSSLALSTFLMRIVVKLCSRTLASSAMVRA